MNRDFLTTDKALYETLMASSARLEALAQECAMMAHLAEQDGNLGFADILRSRSRKHRVEVLELFGQVALLEAEFGGVLRPKG